MKIQLNKKMLSSFFTEKSNYFSVKCGLSALSGILFFSLNAPAMGLDDYLSGVVKKNKNLQAADESLRAASTRYEQANLELSPFLTGRAFYQDDKSNQYGLGSLTTHQEIRQYTLGVAKKFSTGTAAQVAGTLAAVNAEGVMNQQNFQAENHTGTMTFSLTQSLWKDFWGQATQLRWQREALQKKLEVNSTELQKRSFLVEAETAYWDLIYLQNEQKVRETSLERAKRIETWVKSRVNNGIGDKADLLNAQGLVAARELQLISTRDEYKAAQEKIRIILGLAQDESVPQLEGNIQNVRSTETLLEGSGNKVVRIDSYLASLESDTKSVVSEEAAEKIKPDVNFETFYKTNSYDTTDMKALSKITDTNKPVFGVGVNFSWALDWDSKNAVTSTARADALSAKLKKEQKIVEGESAWKELNRRHGELQARIKAAQQLATIQVAKATAEREKLSRGRTVTSNVITAEQDAAEAELTLAKLNVEQRKIEGSTRLFLKIQE